MRRAEIERNTKETQIKVAVNLDGSGTSEIATPLPFFGHMLDAVGRHSLIDLKIEARGDVQVDGHHTVEDIGICLGQALCRALGDKRRIRRYGEATVPMDESLARAVVDISGRPLLVLKTPPLRGRTGTFDLDLIAEFFQAFVNHAGITLHMDVLRGKNPHHIIEALFKAFGRALSVAVSIDPRVKGVPSTKGTL